MSKRFICYLTGLTIVVISLLMATATYLVPRPESFTVPRGYSINAEITLAVDLISADPIARTFVMDWYLYPPGGRCHPDPQKVVDIYVDPGILDTSDPSFRTLPPYEAKYRYNITDICSRNQMSRNAVFRTVSKLLSAGKYQGRRMVTASSIQYYPFDTYFAPLALRGVNADTGERVGLNITRSYGEIVNFSIDLHHSRAEGFTPWLEMVFRLERSLATKVFVVASGITTWLIALVFLVVCVSTLFYRSHEIYTELFVVPVGAVFAFTAIRQGFPGSPTGFGTTFDLYTILPALFILSLCGSFLLLIILYRRIRCFNPEDKIETPPPGDRRRRCLELLFPY